MENVVENEVEFSQEMYEKNILENDFSEKEKDGIGEEENANN